MDSLQDLIDRRCQVATMIIAISLVLWLSGVPIMQRYFGKTRSQQLTCQSADCDFLQGMMRDVLTTDVDPCEDFYTYVCGRWTRHATRYSSFHEDQRRAAKAAVHTHLMTAHHPERERSVDSSMSTLYRNCISHVGKQKTVRQIASDVLRALDINITSWRTMAIGDLVPSLLGLNLLYSLPSLFSVALKGDANLTIGVGLTIRNCSASAYSADKLYIHVQSMIEAITPAPLDDEIVQAVVELDGVVHEATRFPGPREPVPIGQLNLENVTTQTWMQSFNAILPNRRPVRSSTIVNTTGISNIRRVFRIFTDADSSVRVTHLVIILTSDVVRYEFYDRYFDADKLGPSVTCTELVSQFFHDDYPTLEASLLTKDSRERRARLFFEQARAAAMFDLTSNVNGSHARDSLELIKSMTFRTFSPGSVFKNATHTFSDDFITDMFAVRRKLAETRIILGTSYNDTAEMLSAIQWNGGLRYVRSTNSIVVASQNLVPSYFYAARGREHFNYGILVTQLVEELLKALPDEVSTATSCGNALDAELRKFTRAQKVEVLRLSKAARASYRVHRNHSDSRTTLTSDEQLAVDRIFFQRFCMMFCTHALLERRPSLLRMRHRCRLPLESMPEFQITYQCPTKGDLERNGKLCPPVEPLPLKPLESYDRV